MAPLLGLLLLTREAGATQSRTSLVELDSVHLQRPKLSFEQFPCLLITSQDSPLAPRQEDIISFFDLAKKRFP